MKVVLLLRALEVGGSERQAAALAAGLTARGHDVLVLTFYPGALDGEIAACGARLASVGRRGRFDIAGFLCRLARAIRGFRPDVVYSFLPGANVVASAVGPLAGNPPLAWGVRCADVDLGLYGRGTRLVYGLQRLLCRHPRLIVANSRKGARVLGDQGYPAGRIAVVPNGIDTGRFRPDPEARRRVRAEWGIADDQMLVGIAARLDPIKDHATFLRAAARLADRPDLRFACIGPGPDAGLRALAQRLGLDGRVVWAGGRSDMPAVYAALDVAALTSTSEGFPNGIAEAMACGVPCVATDAGDAGWLMGDSGAVVAVGDDAALAAAWRRLAEAGAARRAQLGTLARRRIEDEFGLAALAARTEELLKRM